MKTAKKCPHANIVQSSDETEIRTYCSDCNELIKVEKVKLNPIS